MTKRAKFHKIQQILITFLWLVGHCELTALLLPEGLKEISESFWDELLLQGKWIDLWRDDPYREFNRRLAAAENFTEIGLWQDALAQLEKAENSLQVSWSLLRSRENLSRNLPSLAEFPKLPESKRNFWLTKMYHELRLALQKEELAFVREPVASYEKYLRHCTLLYEQLLAYGYQNTEEKVVLSNLFKLLHTPSLDTISQLALEEPNLSENGRRLLRRLVSLLLAYGDRGAALRQLEAALNKNQAIFSDIALARYWILLDQRSKTIATLQTLSLKPQSDVNQYRIFLHGKSLLFRLWLAQGQIAKAEQLLQKLEQEQKDMELTTSNEIRTYLAEHIYLLKLELCLLNPKLPLPPPAPAFSELSYKLYRHLLSWQEPQNALAQRLSLNNLLTPSTLKAWQEKIANAQQCELQSSSTEAALFTERMISLLAWQPITCPFEQWEAKLLQKPNRPIPWLFYILERRLLLEKAMAEEIPALSLPVQQTLFYFRKVYLLGELIDNIPSLKLAEPKYLTEKNYIYVYQSSQLLAYVGSEVPFRLTTITLPEEPSAFSKALTLHPELLKQLKSEIPLTLSLFARAHMLAWEQEKQASLFRKLPEDVGLCSLCSSKQEWYGIAVGYSTFFSNSKDPTSDIITAFRNSTLVPLNENTANRLSELLKKKDNLLLHLPGQFVNVIDRGEFILQNKNIELLSLRLLLEIRPIGALAFPNSTSHEVMLSLPHIAAQQRAQFLMYSLTPPSDDFQRSFYYDLYSRLARRGKSFVEAFQESQIRAQKSLATQDESNQVAVYVP